MYICPKCGTVPVPEADLPVVLPRDVDFSEGWRITPRETCRISEHDLFFLPAVPAKRKAITMDTFVEILLYFRTLLLSPLCGKARPEQAQVDYWMPVDQYIGGSSTPSFTSSMPFYNQDAPGISASWGR
jgi:leucyl-tRNA synthetase